jgi:hypothetical protein
MCEAVGMACLFPLPLSLHTSSIALKWAYRISTEISEAPQAYFWNTEKKELPLLEAVSKKRLVKP